MARSPGFTISVLVDVYYLQPFQDRNHLRLNQEKTKLRPVYVNPPRYTSSWHGWIQSSDAMRILFPSLSVDADSSFHPEVPWDWHIWLQEVLELHF